MPMQDKPIIETADQNDLYKLLIQQFALLNYPNVPVRFGYTQRSKVRIPDIVPIEAVREEIEHARTVTFTEPELTHLRDFKSDEMPIFTREYLEYLRTATSPETEIGRREDGGAFTLESEGDWPAVTPWEIRWLVILNTLYYRYLLKAKGISVEEAWKEGDRRLSEKIAFFKAHPDMTFIEFGNRRAFSPKWQAHVDQRLCEELPEQCLGISNVALARRFGKRASGTYPHEGDLVLQGIYHDLDDQMGRMYSHEIWLDQWFGMYGYPFSFALTDTYTTEYHLRTFGERRFRLWRAQRLDSGDLERDGELLVQHYRELGIDPMSKLLVPSDGMELPSMFSFANRFRGRAQQIPGWGTNATNDLGFSPVSHVAKPIFACGHSLVKLSNNPEKAQGKPEAIARVKRLTQYRREGHDAVECKY